MTGTLTLALRRRVLAAGSWTVIGFGLGQAIRFGGNLVMTRLLVPEMFGVMAIAHIVLIGLTMCSDVGLRQSVVQDRRGGDAAFLNTIWMIQILRGVAVGAAAIGIAALCALCNRLQLAPAQSVYANAALPAVIAALSLTSVIAGFASTKLLEASRKLQLGHVTRLEIVSQLAGLAAMLAWASYERSVWCLVAGAFASAGVRTVLSHRALAGTANRFAWNAEAARAVASIGKWIFFASVLGFLVNNGDRLLLGGLIPGDALGLYVIALLIVNAVEQALTKVNADVSFPALSHVARERPLELRRGYYRFHAVVASLAYFCAGLLALAGAALVRALFDARYAESGWMLQVLSVSLLCLPYGLAGQYFLALGRSRLLFAMIALRLAALIGLTLGGFAAFGLAGAVWGIALSHFAGVPLAIRQLLRHGVYSLRLELRPTPALVGGAGLGALLVHLLPS